MELYIVIKDSRSGQYNNNWCMHLPNLNLTSFVTTENRPEYPWRYVRLDALPYRLVEEVAGLMTEAPDFYSEKGQNAFPGLTHRQAPAAILIHWMAHHCLTPEGKTVFQEWLAKIKETQEGESQ